jgi:hypothetical protein
MKTVPLKRVTTEQEARKRPDVLRLMKHPGVGPLTALAEFSFRQAP